MKFETYLSTAPGVDIQGYCLKDRASNLFDVAVLDEQLRLRFRAFLDRYCTDSEVRSIDFDLEGSDREDPLCRVFAQILIDTHYLVSLASRRIRTFTNAILNSDLEDRIPVIRDRVLNRLKALAHGVISIELPKVVAFANFEVEDFSAGAFSPSKGVVLIRDDQMSSDSTFFHEYFHAISGISVKEGSPPEELYIYVPFICSSLEYDLEPEEELGFKGLIALNELITELLAIWLAQSEYKDSAKFDFADDSVANSELNTSQYKYLVKFLVEFCKLYNALCVKNGIRHSLEQVLLEWYFEEQGDQVIYTFKGNNYLGGYALLSAILDDIFGSEDFLGALLFKLGSCFDLKKDPEKSHGNTKKLTSKVRNAKKSGSNVALLRYLRFEFDSELREHESKKLIEVTESTEQV